MPKLNQTQERKARKAIAEAYGNLTPERMGKLLAYVADNYQMACEEEPETSKTRNFEFALAIATEREAVRGFLEEWAKEDEAIAFDDDHFCDGIVDVRDVREFLLLVFTNEDAETEAVRYESNLFHPSDLVRAYRKVYESSCLSNKGKEVEEGFVNAFKSWQIYCGCTPSDLEEDYADDL